MEQQKTCKHNGCRKKYLQSQNNQGVCKYHPGKPIFHDTKKGWTCCQKIVYDWDEFQKLPHCKEGKHDDKEQTGPQFFQSNTVQNASNAIKKQENNIQIKNIDEYNKQFQQKKKKQEQEKLKNQKIFVTKTGNHKCINKGCNKQYKVEQNTEDACKFHKGQPVFHDLKKYWTCCGKQTYDWDDFMKLPTCSVGKHVPKTV